MSEFHFQRMFVRWVGISPKRFLQTLTVDYAKSRIAETRSVLELSEATGLSSPGRLHDLFVNLEAMSPGEFKDKGRGLEIAVGIHETPLGYCAIATTPRGICNLDFSDNPDSEKFLEQLQQDWPLSEISLDGEKTGAIADRICQPDVNADKPLALFVRGTNFQVQVWRALLRIPPGGLATYGGLAAAIGRPTAARAVGNAVGRNPVGYFIPCHRVIRESGELGGYRWGVERKTTLLGFEAGRYLSDREDR